MRSFGTAVCCLLAVSIASVLFAQSEGAVAQPGAVVIEPPTTGALGVEWRIQGDDNRNASVAVAARPDRRSHQLSDLLSGSSCGVQRSTRSRARCR